MKSGSAIPPTLFFLEIALVIGVFFGSKCFSGGSAVKSPSARQEAQETWVQSLDWVDPLKKGMAIHSSILAWRIPCTEEPGRL